MKFRPMSNAASSRRKDSASLTVQPKTLPPSIMTGTSALVLPSFRVCMLSILIKKMRYKPAQVAGNRSVGFADADSGGALVGHVPASQNGLFAVKGRARRERLVHVRFRTVRPLR